TESANLGETERLTAQLVQAEVELETQRELHSHVSKVADRDLTRARWGKKLTRTGSVALGGLALVNGATAEPLLALAALASTPVGWWWLARPHETTDQAPVPGDRPKVSLVKQGGAPAAESVPVQTTPTAPYGGPIIAEPDFEAPTPPALTEDALTTALRDARVIKPTDVVGVLSAPPYSEDGTANIVFDLPSGVTFKVIKDKAEALAGALGRDMTMIDLSKAGAEGRISLWISDSDPFEPPRPSPLMTRSGGIDVWHDGVPVAWAKRGNIIALPVRNSHFLIGGMTRSGKGVGMANLAAGAALDVRVNLRIVAGKENGEFDAYAKTGVAATYFKQRPHRLKLLTDALKADMDRRNKILGELGKSKVTPQTINRLGGLELVIVDELATFTRKNAHAERDELLSTLTDLAAVATSAGIILVLTTQYPEADVIPQGLAMNCGTRWAMRVDNATQSNAILGGGAAGAGRDASKFDPPRPGLGWLVNPFAAITDLARSFDLDEDERGEVTALLERAVELREDAGRLAGQWDDPIEQYLLEATGQSSTGGGPDRNGVPGRASLTPDQKEACAAVIGGLETMDALGRDAAQLEEMARHIDGMTSDRLSELLRTAGAGGTTKVTIDGRRVNGYQRHVLRAALDRLTGG
ncbi:hypothetical protein, partial [Streptomyces sp. TR06-5]|uniref:hypothetical protein n=1 Tax=Streptomyces sp. TR06-5 TaxID=3385976 RepID=UPI0039A09CCC